MTVLKENMLTATEFPRRSCMALIAALQSSEMDYSHLSSFSTISRWNETLVFFSLSSCSVTGSSSGMTRLNNFHSLEGSDEAKIPRRVKSPNCCTIHPWATLANLARSLLEFVRNVKGYAF